MNIISRDFDFRSFVVNDVKWNDHYSAIDFHAVDDIHVANEMFEMSLNDKYDMLQRSRGFIHVKDGLCLEIENQRIKSLRLKEKYVEKVSRMSGTDVEEILGIPDQRKKDGITWVSDFVENADVMVYDKLKLHVHVDSATGLVTEIRFGDVDLTEYE